MKSLNGVAAVAAWGALAVGGSAVAQDAVQWRVEDGGNGHWYQIAVQPNSITWTAANDVATNLGGYLASVTSEAESLFVSSLLGDSGPWWIPYPQSNSSTGPYLGGFRADLSAPWQWTTGELWDYVAWCSNQPSNSFCPPSELVLHAKRGNYCNGDALWWGDINTTGECSPEVPGIRSCLVEWSADCNSDGIVDYGQILDGTFADANENGVPDLCECDADINDDGVVNGADISVLLGYWGQSGKNVVGDITGDGIVNGADLAQLLGSWG